MNDLWCIHVEGPDDLIAMPSEEDAKRDAAIMNDRWRNRRDPNENDPAFLAIVQPWPYSADQHAADMQRSISMERGRTVN